METPRVESEGRIAEVLAAAALTLVIGLLVWTPRYVYWAAVADILGETPTLVFVALLTICLGLWVARTTSLALSHLVAGGLLGYVAGMAAIEIVLAPISPAHLVLYALLLACFLGGTLAWRGVERYRRSDGEA